MFLVYWVTVEEGRRGNNCLWAEAESLRPQVSFGYPCRNSFIDSGVFELIYQSHHCRRKWCSKFILLLYIIISFCGICTIIKCPSFQVWLWSSILLCFICYYIVSCIYRNWWLVQNKVWKRRWSFACGVNNFMFSIKVYHFNVLPNYNRRTIQASRIVAKLLSFWVALLSVATS